MKHIIIGAGAAGITAAKTIRQFQPDAEIILIYTDEYVHSRCMLHKFLSHERNEKTLSFIPEDFSTRYQVKCFHNKTVTGIDTYRQTVCLDNNALLAYDKLLIATGAHSFIPPIGDFLNASNVFGLRDLTDAQAINKVVKADSKVLIIGSGLVGLDAAYGLLHRDIDVTIVEMSSQILPMQLDLKASQEYKNRFESAGCKFYMGSKAVATEIDESGCITKVILDNNTELYCDVIIVAAGVRPALDFIHNTNISLEKGIVVDDTMKTTCENIYAAGDVTGLSGIWPNAMKQGETAARNMCGIQSVYVDKFAIKNTINFFGLNTLSLGETSYREQSDIVVVSENQFHYKRAIIRYNKLVGLILQGDISHAGIYQYLIKNNIPLPCSDKEIFTLNYAHFYGLLENGEYTWNLA